MGDVKMMDRKPRRRGWERERELLGIDGRRENFLYSSLFSTFLYLTSLIKSIF